jgi:hypothetical protein
MRVIEMASLETILKGETSRSALQRSGAAAVRDTSTVKDELADEAEVSPDAEETEDKVAAKPEVKAEEKPAADKPASSAEAKTDEPTIPLKTFKDVERRLQDAERKLKAGEKKPEPVKAPDVLEDQEGFRKHIEADFESKLLERTVVMSEDITKRAHADFGEVMGTNEDGTHLAWIEVVKDNPALIEQFRQAANPALFAYETVKRHKALKDIGDPTQFRSKLEAELRAKWDAEQAAKKPLDRPEIPESLADEPSKSARKGPEWSGPKSIKDILKK